MTTDRKELLESAYSPSAPITSDEFFSGRFDQISKAVSAINQRGQHFLVYGERGVGKTSFANVVSTRLENLVVSKVTCSRNDSYRGLWERALGKIRFSRVQHGIGFTAERVVEESQLSLFLAPDKDISSMDVQLILEGIQENLLFVFDEFDSILENGVRSTYAENRKRGQVHLAALVSEPDPVPLTSV